MKKTVFICIGNVLLFTLLGLAFLFPFSNVIQLEGGFQGNITIFPLLLGVYLLVYPVVHYLLAKKYHWGKNTSSELAYSDEREKTIVAESTKISYTIFMGGLLFIIPALGGLQFFTLSTGVEISLYFVSVAFLTLLLNVAAIAYCFKWCIEYKK